MDVTVHNYQELAMRTLGPHNDITYLTMGLVGEVGEVIDYAKKTLYHGHKYESEKLCEEMGDVLWYVAALCQNQDIAFATVAQMAYLLGKPQNIKEEPVLDPI